MQNESLYTELETVWRNYCQSNWALYDAKEILIDTERLLAEREKELMPEAGWEGSNADKRAAHRLQVLGEDLIYLGLQHVKTDSEKISRLEQVKLDNLRVELRIREAQTHLITADYDETP